MENGLYRPLIKGLQQLGYLICTPLDAELDKRLLPALYSIGSFIALFFSGLTDSVIYITRRLAFKRRGEQYVDHPGPRLTAAARLAIDTPMDAYMRMKRQLLPRFHKYRYLAEASLISFKEFCSRHLTAFIFALTALAALAVWLAALIFR